MVDVRGDVLRPPHGTSPAKTSSLFPKQGDQNAKRTEETHRQRAGQYQT